MCSWSRFGQNSIFSMLFYSTPSLEYCFSSFIPVTLNFSALLIMRSSMQRCLCGHEIWFWYSYSTSPNRNSWFSTEVPSPIYSSCLDVFLSNPSPSPPNFTSFCLPLFRPWFSWSSLSQFFPKGVGFWIFRYSVWRSANDVGYADVYNNMKFYQIYYYYSRRMWVYHFLFHLSNYQTSSASFIRPIP